MQRGELELSLPVGLVRDLARRVVFHPDQEVRERLDFVFSAFLRIKSVHGVIREMNTARLLLPRRERGRVDSAMVWRRPTVAAIISLLRNPAYAGIYVYGRTRFGPRVPGGSKRRQPLAQEHWKFMIPDKYPAYIDRQAYDTIQAILSDNYLDYKQRRSRGVVRLGAALLQGMVYCGHCGRKMTVQYHAAARYICNHHKMQMGGTECQRVPIASIDACVVQNFWEALTPAGLDAYEQAFAGFDEQRRQVGRARQQQLQRLRYEAQLAEKQYRLVDPENRLVAAELERRWEQALKDVRQAEAEATAEAAKTAPELLTGAERQQWEEMRPNLRQLWDEGKLSNIRKKELLRILIDKVVLQRPTADGCEVRLVWKGGDWTTVSLTLPVVAYAEMANGEVLIAEVLRRARAGQTDERIASELTAAGYHAPLKESLSADSVYRIRQKHGVYSRKTEFLRDGLEGWLTLGQAVERLGEHSSWAYYLIRKKRLDIVRDPEIGLYLVRNNKKTLKELKELLQGKRIFLTLQPRLS